jgi:hypothetical protein
MTSFGLCGIKGGASDDLARRFFAAAKAFHDSNVYKLLMETQHREFGVRSPTLSRKPMRGFLELYSTVELVGLRSGSAAAMNGLRGEVLTRPEATIDPQDRKVVVRLFKDGRRVSVKAHNLAWCELQDDAFVAKVIGASGGSVGLMVYTCWAELYAHNFSKTEKPLPEPPKLSYLEVNYCSDQDPAFQRVLSKDMALRRRLKLPLTANGRKDPELGLSETFPFLSRGTGPMSVEDVELSILALTAATVFLPMLVSQPDPPKPYPAGYSFQPCEYELPGSGGAVAAFPSGDMGIEFRHWSSCPSLVIMYGARRPSHVITIWQAVKFHRDALFSMSGGKAQVSQSSQLRAAHEFGLANALWETETPAAVAEACALGFRVLEATRGEESVGTFVLDLLMECADWEGIFFCMLCISFLSLSHTFLPIFHWAKRTR